VTLFYFVCSFNSDYQMCLDAQVVVSVRPVDNAAAVPARELLYPPRHQITLPLNNLNFIFSDDIETSFNQTTKLTSDKYVPVDVFLNHKSLNVLRLAGTTSSNGTALAS